MSKQIVTTSTEIARYVTWAITDIVLGLNKTEYSLPTWKQTQELQLGFKKAIEQGQMAESPAAMRDIRELLLSLESLPKNEPVTQ